MLNLHLSPKFHLLIFTTGRSCLWKLFLGYLPWGNFAFLSFFLFLLINFVNWYILFDLHNFLCVYSISMITLFPTPFVLLIPAMATSLLDSWLWNLFCDPLCDHWIGIIYSNMVGSSVNIQLKVIFHTSLNLSVANSTTVKSWVSWVFPLSFFGCWWNHCCTLQTPATTMSLWLQWLCLAQEHSCSPYLWVLTCSPPFSFTVFPKYWRA